jgi:hypothetical protein
MFADLGARSSSATNMGSVVDVEGVRAVATGTDDIHRGWSLPHEPWLKIRDLAAAVISPIVPLLTRKPVISAATTATSPCS